MSAASQPSNRRVAPLPRLKTSCTYDDDEAFSGVALNMLSRYHALGLTVSETIAATLIYPKERYSFLEALDNRVSRRYHASTCAAELAESVETYFGHELRQLVANERGDTPPTTAHNNTIIPPLTPCLPSCRESSGKRKTLQWFFGGGGVGGSNSTSSSSDGERTTPGSSFFRGATAKIKNIDWKMSEAIEQVETLRLDGMDSANVANPMVGRPTGTVNLSYKPPTSPLARCL